MVPADFSGKTLKDIVTHFELRWLTSGDPDMFDTMLGKRDLLLYAAYDHESGGRANTWVYKYPIVVTVAGIDNESNTVLLEVQGQSSVPGMEFVGTGQKRRMKMSVIESYDSFIKLDCTYQVGWQFVTDDTFDSSESWVR